MESLNLTSVCLAHMHLCVNYSSPGSTVNYSRLTIWIFRHIIIEWIQSVSACLTKSFSSFMFFLPSTGHVSSDQCVLNDSRVFVDIRLFPLRLVFHGNFKFDVHFFGAREFVRQQISIIVVTSAWSFTVSIININEYISSFQQFKFITDVTIWIFRQ